LWSLVQEYDASLLSIAHFEAQFVAGFARLEGPLSDREFALLNAVSVVLASYCGQPALCEACDDDEVAIKSTVARVLQQREASAERQSIWGQLVSWSPRALWAPASRWSLAWLWTPRWLQPG
jgi:hypothetical protein